MECLSHKEEITNTFTNVRSFSYQEKVNVLDEEKVDLLLDTIIEFKEMLVNKSSRILDINERIEKLTWYSNLDDECLMLLNDLISSAKDLRSTLIRQYASLNSLRKKGIAKEEIKDFKYSIDELKESYEDLESVFFFLPKIQGFKETTKRLSLI